jgi:hypothetical protein
MAALAFSGSSDSTSRVNEYPPSSQRKIVSGTLTVSGSEGAAVDSIPASLFGLSKIEDSRPLVKSDNTLVVVTAPAYNGGSLLGKAAATAAPANVPAGDYHCIVLGY